MRPFASLVFKCLAVISFLGGSVYLSLFLLADDQILFQSLESKTNLGGPVFNRLVFKRMGQKEIWMMQQSHEGLGSSNWDRLAIVVEKKGIEKRATFLQLPPGKLEWSEELWRQQLPHKVACLMCHSNGPRAIRALQEGEAPIKIANRLKLWWWNLQIKSAGKIEAHSAPSPKEGDQQVLKLKSCFSCHGGEGIFARQPLTRQNAPTIEFMVSTGQMPPLGHSLSVQDAEALKDFVQGF